jgi:hypothetical protein
MQPNRNQIFMHITDLRTRPELHNDPKTSALYDQFRALLRELNKKPLTPEVIESVSQDVADINATTRSGNELRKFLKHKQSKIIKLVEQELKIVPKKHYRNLWLVIGMSSFGLPLGLVFGLLMDNLGLMAIGLPVGMAMGMAVGSNMDKKAFQEGRQLDVTINH